MAKKSIAEIRNKLADVLAELCEAEDVPSAVAAANALATHRLQMIGARDREITKLKDELERLRTDNGRLLAELQNIRFGYNTRLNRLDGFLKSIE